MTVVELLTRQSRRQAAGRAAHLAARIALAGAALVAVALLLARMGFDVPLLWMPRPLSADGFFPRLFGFLAISLAGLIQGVIALAIVFAFALAMRRLGPALLRRDAGRTARALDATLGTDRFCSALEARGRLRAAVAGHATRTPPPDDALAPPPPGRLQRWLTRAATLLVLLVALSPGVAGGEEGRAPMAGAPSEAPEERGLVLKLFGESRTFGPHEPVVVHVVAETMASPDRDLELDVRLVIDGGDEQPTGRQLFLPAGTPGEDATSLDLRRFARDLAPGEHRAVARAGEAESNEYRFRIEAPPGADSAAPKPEPKEKPQRKPDGAPERGTDPELDPKFVEPLIREGEKIRKKAKVPIEVPGAAPEEKTLEEAWPELERRREAALKRLGLSPHARKLVREYFERLRPAK